MTRIARRSLVLALLLGLALVPAPHHARASDPRVAAPYRFAQDPGGEPDPQLYDDTVVRDVRITFAQAGWPNLPGCNRGPGGPGVGGPQAVDAHARLEVDDVVIEDVGVRCKGNSSLGIQGMKKPLNVTIDAFVTGQDLWGFDVFNLNNGWNDPSLVREALALRILREFMPVPRLTFARVTVQGAYVGLYQLVEQINGEFADFWYPDDDGMVVKGDSPERITFDSSTLSWLGEDLRPYKAAYEVKGPLRDGDEGYVAVRELTRALDAAASAGGLSDAAFADGIRQVLDVDSALWYLAGQNIITNFDSYYVGKNYYLYQGRKDPRFDLIPWDQGLSFGLFGLRGPGQGGPGGGGGTPATSATADPFAQEGDANRPLIRRLLAVPSYRADYVAHYRALRDSVFKASWIEEVGASYQDAIRPAAEAEIAAQGTIGGSYTLAQFDANLREDLSIGRRGSIPGILPLVEARSAYLATHDALAAPDQRLADPSHAPEAPTAADAVVIRAVFAGGDAPVGVAVRYRVDGGLEMEVAMTQGEDGAWAAEIPAQRAGRRVTYVFRAETADGRASFFPDANQIVPFGYDVAGVDLPLGARGDLVLNELMADNETAVADEAGEFDDWLELYNRGAEPIDLVGFFVSDDPADPFAFALPAGQLAPGAHLLIWTDNDPEQGPLHAPFRLNGSGESAVLSTVTAIVDQLDFDALPTNLSLGRVTDGAEAWDLCGRPTPGRANRCNGPEVVPEAVYLPVGWGG